MGSWIEVNIGCALLWLQWGVGIYLFILEKTGSPYLLLCLLLGLSICLCGSWISLSNVWRELNPWKSQFSITGISDLAEVSEDPINFARKKKNNTKPLLFIPFWFDSLSWLSFQRARGSSTTTKGSFTAFFGISYGRIRCLTFQQYVKRE